VVRGGTEEVKVVVVGLNSRRGSGRSIRERKSRPVTVVLNAICNARDNMYLSPPGYCRTGESKVCTCE
jgi:hypothetical protein